MVLIADRTAITISCTLKHSRHKCNHIPCGARSYSDTSIPVVPAMAAHIAIRLFIVFPFKILHGVKSFTWYTLPCYFLYVRSLFVDAPNIPQPQTNKGEWLCHVRMIRECGAMLEFLKHCIFPRCPAYLN